MTLEIMNVTTSNGGQYTCVVNSTDRVASGSVTIHIQPEFIVQPVSIEVSNGSMTTLICEASAFPDPSYMWERVDRGDIRSDVTTSSSTLVLDPLLFGDEGDYYCNASSGGATIQSHTITITGN